MFLQSPNYLDLLVYDNYVTKQEQLKQVIDMWGGNLIYISNKTEQMYRQDYEKHSSIDSQVIYSDNSNYSTMKIIDYLYRIKKKMEPQGKEILVINDASLFFVNKKISELLELETYLKTLNNLGMHNISSYAVGSIISPESMIGFKKIMRMHERTLFATEKGTSIYKTDDNLVNPSIKAMGV